MLSPTQPVANIVLDHSECAQVFQQHRIDFCCRGELSLEQAAKERGVELTALLGQLERAIAERRGDTPGAMREASTPALIDHIVGKHHAYLREALPFVRPLAAKVARVHGEHNPKLRALDGAVGELSETLLAHLDDEEANLFPALRSAGASVDPETTRALAAMRDEHLAVAKLLGIIRDASDDFALPDWACGSYRALFGELQAIERDVFQHVHLENHVLAPRFGHGQDAVDAQAG
ncbi:iron-sulfur cluster repair di-iron protein [Sorangium sp. So ce854]|uniref:iron-sulfur cluster repair di-iron protein n=1 Tax=Sorangium sp. So ce854 TaxID=3133322 RepID=UPI003F62D929